MVHMAVNLLKFPSEFIQLNTQLNILRNNIKIAQVQCGSTFHSYFILAVSRCKLCLSIKVTVS